MGSLLTEDGLRRKVLITRRGVRCAANPGEQPTGSRVALYTPFFVVGEDSSSGSEHWLQLARVPSRKDALGWVPRKVTAAWNLRLSGARAGRAPLLVYPTAEALIEFVKEGHTDIEPIARTTGPASTDQDPWPIAERRVVDVNGRRIELYRLLFLGRFREGATLLAPDPTSPKMTADEVADIGANLRKLDVVFVVDNTSSTAPFIDGIRSTMSQLASKLSADIHDVDIRFGIVLYRDYVDGLYFPGGAVTSVQPLRDLAGFLDATAKIAPAAVGSRGLPEAVYDGVHDALSRTQWRGEGLSQRVVCLIGDNSAKLPATPGNPSQVGAADVIQLAKSKEVHATIFSLPIHGAGDASERATHMAQFRELALDTGGTSAPLADAARIAESIKAILGRQIAVVGDRGNTWESLTKPQRQERKAAGQPLAEKRRNLLEFLRNYGDIDISTIGVEEPAFASGWVLASYDGQPLVKKMVYIAREELGLLLSILNRIVAGRIQDVAELLWMPAQASRTDGVTIEQSLRARGVPCSPRSILNRTPAQLRNMLDDDRIGLRDDIVQRVIPQLTNAQSQTAAFAFVEQFEFGFILESYLP